MPNDIANALVQLTQNFIDSSLERLTSLDQIIDDCYNDIGDRGEQYRTLIHEIHSLKGNAGTFGFPLVSAICHRLEDYLEATQRLDQEQWLEVQRFIDEIQTILEPGIEPNSSQHRDILARLPSSAVKTKAIDAIILLVMEPGVIRTILGTKLMEEGIHVSFAKNPIEALNMALALKPDMVAASQQLASFTGLELAKVLSVIDATKSTSFALLTANQNLKVPKGIEVILKDQNVADHIISLLHAQQAA